MTPEQAWQAALGQLQLEMPKATFDTWVRDARFLSFVRGEGASEENTVAAATFTIGFANAYARDWVGSRLTSTISRLLTGILGCQVRLDYVVPELPPKVSYPEEAWEVVYNQLVARVAKENFDYYLRGARFLAYYNFVIGMPTAEARVWAEDTVSHPCLEMLRAQRLIAWCLYGYANKTNDDRPGIDAPILFAVSRYTEAAPGPDYLAFARKTPAQLVGMAARYSHQLTRSQQQILSLLEENGFFAKNSGLPLNPGISVLPRGRTLVSLCKNG